MVWFGLAIGAVVGGKEATGVDGSGGGTKNFNTDSDSSNGGHGLFAIGSHPVWLYVGGIVGFGNTVGPYLTAGPMIGADPDLAIGGGIHFGKFVGIGVVVPVLKTLSGLGQHGDKAVYAIQNYYEIASRFVGSSIPAVQSGLERIITDPTVTSIMASFNSLNYSI